MLIFVTCLSVSAVNTSDLAYSASVVYNSTSEGNFSNLNGFYSASPVTVLNSISITPEDRDYSEDVVLYCSANIYFTGPTSTNQYSLDVENPSSFGSAFTSSKLELISPAVSGTSRIPAQSPVYRASGVGSWSSPSLGWTFSGFEPVFTGASLSSKVTLTVDCVSVCFFENYSQYQLISQILDKLQAEYDLINQYYPQFLQYLSTIDTNLLSSKEYIADLYSMIANLQVVWQNNMTYNQRSSQLLQQLLDAYTQSNNKPLDDVSQVNKDNMQTVDDFESSKRNEAKQDIDTIFSGVGSLSVFSTAFSLIGGMFALCWNGLGSLYVVVYLPLVFALAGVLIGRAEHSARSSRHKDNDSGGDT